MNISLTNFTGRQDDHIRQLKIFLLKDQEYLESLNSLIFPQLQISQAFNLCVGTRWSTGRSAALRQFRHWLAHQKQLDK